MTVVTPRDTIMDGDDDDITFVVKNLDTGETLDLDEAEVKFSVMGLQSWCRI